MPDSDNPADTEKLTDHPEAFTHDLPLTVVFGAHPRTRIISALLSESEDPTTDFTVSEITRISGVVDDAVTEHLDDLRTFGLVVETDELEDQPTYRLDDERAVVADIRQLYSDLFEEMP
jgi:DNA-binding transcriptional ArsR family regulator